MHPKGTLSFNLFFKLFQVILALVSVYVDVMVINTEAKYAFVIRLYLFELIFFDTEFQVYKMVLAFKV